VQRAVEIYNIPVKIMLITIAKIKHNRDSLYIQTETNFYGTAAMFIKHCLHNARYTTDDEGGEGGRGREG